MQLSICLQFSAKDRLACHKDILSDRWDLDFDMLIWTCHDSADLSSLLIYYGKHVIEFYSYSSVWLEWDHRGLYCLDILVFTLGFFLSVNIDSERIILIEARGYAVQVG